MEPLHNRNRPVCIYIYYNIIPSAMTVINEFNLWSLKKKLKKYMYLVLVFISYFDSGISIT